MVIYLFLSLVIGVGSFFGLLRAMKDQGESDILGLSTRLTKSIVVVAYIGMVAICWPYFVVRFVFEKVKKLLRG